MALIVRGSGSPSPAPGRPDETRVLAPRGRPAATEGSPSLTP
ncbi:hypothetical protein ACLESO_59330 [Pyxidicoccus sp. 3LG]